LQISKVTIDNYQNLKSIITIYKEKALLNYTFPEFLLFTAKYDQNDDFINHTMLIFNKYEEKINHDYNSFLQDTKLNI